MRRKKARNVNPAVAVLLVCVLPGTPVNAGEDTSPDCKTKVSATGIPHQTESRARLFAQVDWLIRAKEQGDGYAMWHNARDKNLTCKKLPRSSLIRCYVSATPCLAQVGGDQVQ